VAKLDLFYLRHGDFDWRECEALPGPVVAT